MPENADATSSESFDLPFRSPVKPVELGLDDRIRFDCRKGIACFNECCRNIDILLTPYDLLRLKRRLGLTSRQLLARHTLPFEMDHHGMPGLKLGTKKGSRECQFMTEEGCSVYQDRPAACRYYALGAMAMRKQDSPTVEDVFFVVKEDHCLGHQEPRELTIREYRKAQGVEEYDAMNRDWREVILKKRSSGPTVGKPSERSLDLFWMASYDLEGFRDFISSPGFLGVFDLKPGRVEELETSDEALIAFAGRFLKQVLFGEQTIPRKDAAVRERLQRRRAEQQAKAAGGGQGFDARYDPPASD